MAAVIARALCVHPCQAMTKMCDSCCDAVGACCDSINKCFSDTCGACCASCGKCMDRWCQKCCSQECVENLCRPCSNFFAMPFSSCTLFTFFIAFCPAIVIFITVLPAMQETCVVGEDSTDKRTWAIVQAIVFLCHFIMSIYVLTRFSRPYDLDDPNDRNFTRRVSHALCEDVGFALYICVIIFAFIWNILGNFWTTTCENDTVNTVMTLANTLGWAYFIIGGLAFLLGSCSAGMAEGACTESCPYLCVCCGQALFGDMCCPREDHHQRQAANSNNIVISVDGRGGGGGGGGYQAPQQAAPVHMNMDARRVEPPQPVHSSAPMPVATAQPVQQNLAPQVIVHTPGVTQGQVVGTSSNAAAQREEEPSLGDTAMAAGAAVGKLGWKGLKVGVGALTGAAKAAKRRTSR